MSRFTLITGPMFAGKTTLWIKKINTARQIHGSNNVGIFHHSLVPPMNLVKCHNQLEIESKSIENLLDIDISNLSCIAINEIQFFDQSAIDFVQKCLSENKEIIANGLDLTSGGEPFGPMPWLLCYATTVLKLTADCDSCHKSTATRTQRLAQVAGNIFVSNSKKDYEARCLKCWNPKG